MGELLDTFYLHRSSVLYSSLHIWEVLKKLVLSDICSKFIFQIMSFDVWNQYEGFCGSFLRVKVKGLALLRMQRFSLLICTYTVALDSLICACLTPVDYFLVDLENKKFSFFNANNTPNIIFVFLDTILYLLRESQAAIKLHLPCHSKMLIINYLNLLLQRIHNFFCIF